MTAPHPLDLAYDAGLWVPTYYGNRYKVSRKIKDHRYRSGKFFEQQDSPEVYATLADARAEADRRNRGKRQ